MNQITDYLEQLNLSDIESKLYLTLLESGPISVRELAETADMKRTTAYLYIDQLIDKGLVIKVVKGSRKLIAVQDPEMSLKTLLNEKLQTSQTLEEEFPTILQRISETIHKGKDIGEAEVKYYKGKNGVQSIYEEALSAQELRSYANLGDVENLFPENKSTFDNAFAKNKKLKLHEIVEDSSASREIVEVLSQNKRYNFKFLPKSVTISASDILIYGGKVAIINVRGSVTGVVFHNKDYFNISKELFDYMWRVLPSL